MHLSLHSLGFLYIFVEAKNEIIGLTSAFYEDQNQIIGVYLHFEFLLILSAGWERGGTNFLWLTLLEVPNNPIIHERMVPQCKQTIAVYNFLLD